MISMELIKEKGFRLHPRDNVYEFITRQEKLITKITEGIFEGANDIAILQLDKDLNNPILYVDGFMWELKEDDFLRILDRL